ncbi:MAG: S24/S26 family peptidase [Clostridia bacterium]|nr:S24/S26 family peptidase [Clostridia bacterium]
MEKSVIDELNKKGVAYFIPKGNSMWPTLKDKAQPVLIKKATEPLNVYDVALYKKEDGTLVLHRVIKVLEDFYVFLGDSQIVEEKVEKTQVLGVMVGFYKGNKFIETNDQSYIKRVKKWFKNEKFRRFRIKLFYLRLKIFAFFKKRKKENV